jgi:polyhydroxybutyrate depolymerase
VSRAVRRLKPKPALHVAGENDELVKFAGQQQIMQAVRVINGCEGQGKGWGKGCLLYASKKGTPFVSFIHPGGHQYPDEAPPIIVRFFKEHTRMAPPQP